MAQRAALFREGFHLIDKNFVLTGTNGSTSSLSSKLDSFAITRQIRPPIEATRSPRAMNVPFDCFNRVPEIDPSFSFWVRRVRCWSATSS